MIKAVSNTNSPVPRRRQFVIVSILQIILAGVVLALVWLTLSPVFCHHYSVDIKKKARVFLLSRGEIWSVDREDKPEMDDKS